MKKIKIEPSVKEQILQELIAEFKKQEITEDTFRFTKSLKEHIEIEGPKVLVTMSTLAYTKMLTYVHQTSTEIAWHGTVSKLENRYHIHDVFLYPQVITSVTVNTDDVEYAEWLNSLDDNTFNHMRFQGHSHVNMGVTPSGVDIDYYNTLLRNLDDEDFYIFMIMNKRNETTWLIYDLEKNIFYESKDVDFIIVDEEGVNLVEEIDKQKAQFCKTPAPKITNTYAHTPGFNSIYSNYLKELNTGYINAIEEETEVDKLFANIDAKYKNNKILNYKPPKGKRKNDKFKQIKRIL